MQKNCKENSEQGGQMVSKSRVRFLQTNKLFVFKTANDILTGKVKSR